MEINLFDDGIDWKHEMHDKFGEIWKGLKAKRRSTF